MADPSFASDTPDLADIDDGHSPSTRKIARLMAVFILPSIFLILVAVALVLFLLPKLKAGHGVPVAPVAAQPVDKDAQIAALQGQIAVLQGQLGHPAVTAAAPGAPPVPALSYAADSAALTQLSARLDRIEASQRALAHAAAAAAAADSLRDAADSGGPFPTELALVQSSLANPHLLDAVRPFADKGIPSKVTLAAQFPHVAATANIAAKGASGDKSLMTKLRHSLGSFISVRRTDTATDGVGVEATLARAENRMNAGDLGGAVGYLNGLPVAAQTAIKPWLDQARARVALDAATRQISENALGTLGQANTETNTGGAL